jgi:hypothetical protein
MCILVFITPIISVYEYKTYSKRQKLYAFTGTWTNVVCFWRVLPSCVNALSYLRVQQTTTLSQHPSAEAQLASHMPRKISDLKFMFELQIKKMYWCLWLIYPRRDWLYSMEDREPPWMHKYRESKTTRFVMATVRHVTAWVGRPKYRATWFLLNRVYRVFIQWIHNIAVYRTSW